MQHDQTRILVVDDDPGIRHALDIRLTRAGYQVQTVASGEDALVVCLQNPPHVIILDISMPGMDGFDVCAKVRETIGGPIAVIFLTGTTHAGTSSCLEQCVNTSGGDYFLVKPCDTELIVNLVARIMREELISIG